MESSSKSKSLICRVALLDDSEIEVTVDKKAFGLDLFESVCQYLRLNERDYFGLVHTASKNTGLWVRPEKQLKKQFNHRHMKWEFAFRVKFYPADPSVLKEEIARYQLCLQVRYDLTSGNLQCELDQLAEMSAYWLQSEFGDSDGNASEVRNYLGSLRPKSKKKELPDFDQKVINLYKEKKEIKPDAADSHFLQLASNLQLYGVHFYDGTDKAGKNVRIGIGSPGVYEVREKVSVMIHTWRRIKNIVYRNHKFKIKLLRAPPDGDPRLKKTFLFDSEEQSRLIWQFAVDHHVFFRIDGLDKASTTSSSQAKPFKLKRKRTLSFRKGSKKHKKGEKEKVQLRPKPTVVRGASFRRSASFRETSASTSVTDSPLPTTIKTLEETPTRTRKASSSKDEKENLPQDKIVKIENVVAADILSGELADISEGAEDSDRGAENVRKESEHESDGEEFQDEDFVEDVLDTVEGALQSSSSLLLTETIAEEDEESQHSEEKSEEDEIVSSPIEAKDVKDDDLVDQKSQPTENINKSRSLKLLEPKSYQPLRLDNLSDENQEILAQKNPEPIQETDLDKLIQKNPDKEFEKNENKADELTENKSVDKNQNILENVRIPTDHKDQIFERDIENPMVTESVTDRPEYLGLKDMDELDKIEALVKKIENDSVSDDGTLTPGSNGAQNEPRRKSEVRFQDEIEIKVTNDDFDKSSSSSDEGMINYNNQTEDFMRSISEEEEYDYYGKSAEIKKSKDSVEKNHDEDTEVFDIKESIFLKVEYEDISIKVPELPLKKDKEEKNNYISTHPLDSPNLPSKLQDRDDVLDNWRKTSYSRKPTLEDEVKTEGVSTTGAELGDDDFLLDDLSQCLSEGADIDISSENPVKDENFEIDLEFTSDETLSDITDNTDELCSPKIVEQTWLKTLSPNDEMFLELFRKRPRSVKLRKHQNTKNRKKFQSQILDVNLEEEFLADQKPPLTPRETSTLPRKRTPRREPLVEREGSSRRRFIPSWPFDPQAFINKLSDDDLDKQAFAAAMEAQKELSDENKRIEEMDFWLSATGETPDSTLDEPLFNDNHGYGLEENLSKADTAEYDMEKLVTQPVSNLKDVTPERRSTNKSRSPSQSPRRIGEQFIPGVPDFVHSVIHNYLHSSSSSSSSTPQKEIPKPPTYSETLQNGEALKYPSEITTFSAISDKNSNFISYEPSSRKSKDNQSNPQNEEVFADSSEQDESGGTSSVSTTSSSSSFPRFIHSVFPLRKLSSSSGEKKRGRSRNRRSRGQKKSNKIAKKHKSRSSQRKENSKPLTPNSVNDKPVIVKEDSSKQEVIDNIILSENDDVHFAGNETPDTVRKLF